MLRVGDDMAELDRDRDGRWKPDEGGEIAVLDIDAGLGARRAALAGINALRPAAMLDTGTAGVEAVCTGPGGLMTCLNPSPGPDACRCMLTPCPDVCPTA